MKVRVYRNLHRNVWSVKRGKEPVRHMETLTLSDVVFRVQPAGNKKVRARQSKVVHAFAVGELTERPPESWPPQKVTYNPYVNDTFVSECGRSVSEAHWVFFTKKGEVYAVSTTPRLKPGACGS